MFNHRCLLVVIAAFFIVLFFNSIPISFAQIVTTGPPPPAPINVTTDKTAYAENETIIISGQINNNQIQQLSNSFPSVSIEIIDPQGRKTVSATVPLSERGSYSYNVNVSSKIFQTTGEYKVIATYGGFNSVALFMVIAHPYILTIQTTNYPIDYTIESGLLTNITVNVQEKSLVLHIANSTKAGKLTISLPREVVDSQSNDARDTPFMVFINDKQEVQYNETKLSGGARTLQISIPYEGQTNPAGIWNVKIIGTKMVPEFGSLAVVVLAASGIAVSIMARNRRIPDSNIF